MVIPDSERARRVHKSMTDRKGQNVIGRGRSRPTWRQWAEKKKRKLSETTPSSDADGDGSYKVLERGSAVIYERVEARRWEKEGDGTPPRRRKGWGYTEYRA